MDERKLPFLEHLGELRTCIRNALIALILATSLTYAFAEELFVLIARPLINAWHEAKLGPAQVHFGSLTEPFWVYLKVAMYAGLFLASPFVFHQIWRFVAPGLYQKERRVALPFAVFSALFFITGALFCYQWVLPAAFRFFLSFAAKNTADLRGTLGFLGFEVAQGPEVTVMPTLFMGEYLGLAMKMMLAFGLIFEMPLFIFFLSYVGLVTHRSLWRFNKYAVVLSFVIGGALTPGPDVLSQLLMAGPMIVLYNLSIVVALVVTRRREAREAEAAAGAPAT